MPIAVKRRMHPMTPLQKWIKVVLQTILVAELIVAAWERNWFPLFLITLTIFLTLLPVLVRRRFDVYIPPEFEIAAITFIFAALFLGEIGGYYQRFWWWDVALHTGAGFLLGLVGFLLVYVMNEQEDIAMIMKPGFVAFFSFSFAMALGALWEIFEFAMDGFFGLNMQKSGLRDTMWDLIVDAVGAFVVAAWGYVYLKRPQERSFIDRWITRFIEGNPHLFRRRRRRSSRSPRTD
ncbi:MAG: hypothetical protein Kow0059_15600 [Candidatus Sumerlaeia bacterium]